MEGTRISTHASRLKAMPRFRAIVVAAVSVLATLTMVGPGARAASAQVNPSPPSTSFVHVQLARLNPTTADTSYIGTFWVQYRYGSNALDWWFRLAPKWVQEAGGNPVTLNFTVTTRGKQVNNYQPHEKPATYFFHSSIENFEFVGDAFWTHHHLHPGDTVDISTDFSYRLPNAKVGGHSVLAQHDFWAHYRVGIR